MTLREVRHKMEALVRRETPMDGATVRWMLESDEPWTRYRVLVDLLGRPATDPDVQAARQELLAHPQVNELIRRVAGWPGGPLTRHNDASHPIYAFSTLADFGLRADDEGMDAGVVAILARQSTEGAFQTLINVPTHFGGSGQDQWTWVACDAPTLLYVLLAMDAPAGEHLAQAVRHLADLAEGNGWRCAAAGEMGRFKGPGRRADPCPIANVYALKALALAPGAAHDEAARAGVEMLLSHWDMRGAKKYFLFGVGTDFRKLKYPFVWYDILHVVDVLSRFPWAWDDPRFREMVEALVAQADADGRYTAGSMYRAWKVWSFADKRHPSPWLTCLVYRILMRRPEAGPAPA
jgi:hypothetical protein